MRGVYVRGIAVGMLLLLPLCGCGRRQVPAQEEKPDVQGGLRKMFPSVDRAASSAELRIIGQHYIGYQAGGKSPSRLEDLSELKRDHPKIHKAIQDGVYVVNWSVPLTGSAQTILAYVRDAPTKGGVVLLVDGSTRNMTAAEFEAAPKPGQ